MNCNTTEHPKALTLLAIGLFIFTVFQLTQVLADRVTLSQAHTQIRANIAETDKALEAGTKMVDQLNEVAIATQKLADAGNANAKEITTQMNRLGIKINPDFKKGQPTTPTAVPAAPAPAPTAP